MGTTEFIRVDGILYRARAQQSAAPQYVEHKGQRYKLANLPLVHSRAANLIAGMQRLLHDEHVDDKRVLDQLNALRDALKGREYGVASRIWGAIQPSVLSLMDHLQGPARNAFGKQALDLDDVLTGLEKTVKKEAAAPALPSYVTVDGHLYRLRR